MSELPKSESLQSTESLELLESSESQAMESILEGENEVFENLRINSDIIFFVLAKIMTFADLFANHLFASESVSGNKVICCWKLIERCQSHF